MNIKPAVYNSLTPRQRLIAGIEAIARKDDAEWDKLRETCPKLTYKMEDHRFLSAFQLLLSQATMVELMLTSDLLSMVIFNNSGNVEKTDELLQRAVDTYTGWKEHVEALGINPDAMNGMMKGIRHPVVAFFIERELENLPEPDPDKVKENCESWSGVFANYQ